MPRYRSYHLQLPFTHDDSHSMRWLYGMRVLRDLVNKMSLFFLPIYLFSMGSKTDFLAFLPLSDFQRGMVLIGGFFLTSRVVSAVVALPVGRLIATKGLFQTFVMSYAFRLAVLLGLYMAGTNPWLVVVAAIADGFQSNLFWPTYHTILSKFTVKTQVGQNLGLMQFLFQLAGVISPAISGLIGYWFGMDVLFLLGISVTLIEYVVALHIKISLTTSPPSLKEFRLWLRERGFRRAGVSFAGRYINDAVLFLWPLYVFLFVGSLEEVGFLYTASLFLALIFTFFLGMKIDHTKSKKPFYMSGLFLSGIWVARTQVWSVWTIAAIDTFDRLTGNFHWLFWDMLFMRRSIGKKALAYFIYQELVMNITGVIFWSIFLGFFVFYTRWDALFVFGAVGALLSMLMRDRQLTSPRT